MVVSPDSNYSIRGWQGAKSKRGAELAFLYPAVVARGVNGPPAGGGTWSSEAYSQAATHVLSLSPSLEIGHGSFVHPFMRKAMHVIAIKHQLPLLLSPLHDGAGHLWL